MKQTPASRKVNETARAVLASLLLTEFSDPRLELITITEVLVSKDRGVAEVFVSSSEDTYRQTQEGLESAKGRLRSLLGHELGWRVTPELRFIIDVGIDHAAQITEALKHVPESMAAQLSSPRLDEVEGEERSDERNAGDPLAVTEHPHSTPVTAGGVVDLIKAANTIAISGHVNPDGDALGSTLGMTALCRALGKNATALLAQDRPAPELYEFLPDYNFTAASQYTDTPDLFIAVDSPSGKRIESSLEVMQRAKTTLVVDHHPNYEPYATYYFGDETAPAAGTLVWQIIKAGGITPTKAMAEYCYVAVMTDTGRFSFSNTNHQAFVDAAQMIDLGVNPAYVSRMVYENKSLEAMKLEALLISRIKFLASGELVYSYIYDKDMRDLGVARDATEGLPAILRAIKGVQVAALFREEDNGVRVNLRSNSGFDVGELAVKFGGGGHAAAAGISLEMSLDDALEHIVPKLVALF
jgi:phosphoesterase RecJ-like protein